MTDILMPQLGETVTEGTITKWYKHVGDAVAADEALFEVSTDKVDTDVPSPVAGVIDEILASEGATIAVGGVIARVGGAGAGSSVPGPALTTAPPVNVVVAPPVVAAPPLAPTPLNCAAHSRWRCDDSGRARRVPRRLVRPPTVARRWRRSPSAPATRAMMLFCRRWCADSSASTVSTLEPSRVAGWGVGSPEPMLRRPFNRIELARQRSPRQGFPAQRVCQPWRRRSTSRRRRPPRLVLRLRCR